MGLNSSGTIVDSCIDFLTIDIRIGLCPLYRNTQLLVGSVSYAFKSHLGEHPSWNCDLLLICCCHLFSGNIFLLFKIF